MKKKILISLIFVILFCVGGLGYYKYFIYEKQIEEFGISKEIDFPYWYLLNKESKTVKDLTPVEILSISYDLLDSEYIESYDRTTELPTKDSDSITYPEYPEYPEDPLLICDPNSGYKSAYTLGDIKRILQLLNFTVEEIENMDYSLWNCVYSGGKNNNFYVVEKDDIDSKILELFGTDNNIFDDSFVILDAWENRYSSGNVFYVYDKSVEKLIIWPTSQSDIINSKPYVIDEYESSGEYKLIVVEAGFINNVTGEYPRTVRIYKPTITNYNYSYDNPLTTYYVDSEEKESLMYEKILEYKDQLDNYEITFKKVGDTYQFLSLDYID